MIPAITASSMPDYVPWVISDDRTLVCLVSGTEKKLCSLAETMCTVTKERGVTEVRLVDHSLQPKMKATPMTNFFNLCHSQLEHVSPTSNIMSSCQSIFAPFKVGADGQQNALAYRYLVTADVNTHSFKPKELEPGTDLLSCRSTQLGAAWAGKFTLLPRCVHCDVVFEASCYCCLC